MNLFRWTPSGKLDRQYMRVCSVYKLLKLGRIGKARAVELLTARRAVDRPLRLVELWINGPFRNMKVAP